LYLAGRVEGTSIERAQESINIPVKHPLILGSVKPILPFPVRALQVDGIPGLAVELLLQ
jgi:hypothetical protein